MHPDRYPTVSSRDKNSAHSEASSQLDVRTSRFTRHPDLGSTRQRNFGNRRLALDDHADHRIEVRPLMKRKYRVQVSTSQSPLRAPHHLIAVFGRPFGDGPRTRRSAVARGCRWVPDLSGTVGTPSDRRDRRVRVGAGSASASAVRSRLPAALPADRSHLWSRRTPRSRVTSRPARRAISASCSAGPAPSVAGDRRLRRLTSASRSFGRAIWPYSGRTGY